MSFYKRVLMYIFLGLSSSSWAYEQITLPNLFSVAHAYIGAGMYEDAVQSLKKIDPKSSQQVNELNFAMGKIYLGINQPQNPSFF